MKRNPPDLFLFTVSILLLVLGLIVISSASAPESLAITSGKSVFHYGLKQLTFALIGLGLMFFFMKFPYQGLKKFTVPMVLITIVLLVAVLFVAKEVKGATRWINLGFFQLQPSEMAKLAVIMAIAHYCSEINNGIKNFVIGIFLPLFFLGVICALIMLEPDLGTTIVIFMSAMIMLFAAGAKLFHLIIPGLVGFGAGVVMIITEPYRLERLFAFLNPWKDPKDTGWQIIQSLYALGSGGPMGLGLGMSRQKFHYLPEAHTDYIFSILGEELGLLGTISVIVLFFFLAWRGYKIAIAADDFYGRMLAVGITSCLVFQALLNISVVTSSVPVTGITLPFLSYGGSSLLVSLMGIGVLLNISKNSE